MTTIVIQLTTVDTPLPAANIPFAHIALDVVDNAGAKLSTVTLTGAETPPWSATLSGAVGPHEVTATAIARDTAGNDLGTPLTATESGTGGQPNTPGSFPQPTALTITVT